MTFRDHTLGSLPKSIASLALPSMANHFLIVAFQVIDLAWVGRLGPAPLAAVASSTFLFWCLLSLTEAISIGTGSLVGQAVGARDRARVLDLSLQGLVLGLLWSLLSAAVLVAILQPSFRLMGLDPEVARLGHQYLVVLMAGSPAVLGFLVLEAVFRARGDAATPFRALTISAVVNIALDPFLIFGIGPFPRLGVAGAALSTVMTRGIAALVLLLLLWPDLREACRARGGLRLDWRNAARVLRIGSPIAVSGFFFSIVYVVLARIVGLFGTEAVGALGIGHKMESISFITCVGFGAAAETLVAQNLGAGQPDRAERAAWTCVGILTAIETAYGCAFLLFATPFASLFSADPLVVRQAASYLWIMAWSQPLMGIEVALERAFGGAGKTLPPMAVSIPVTGLRIPLAWALAVPGGLGAQGIWIAISATAVARGVLIAIWFRAGTWKRQPPGRARQGVPEGPAIP